MIKRGNTSINKAPVDKLGNSMRKLGHQQFDLLKLETVCWEHPVIHDVRADNLNAKIILVEFNEFHHRKGFARFAVR